MNPCTNCGDSTKRTRTCRTCGTTDPSCFYETQSSNYCRPCHKQKYFAPGRARLLSAKLQRGECADCHLQVTAENACAFDFDHLTDKELNVSSMVTYSDMRFEREVAKCELVCSNCHRLRTQTRPRVHPNPGRPRRNPLLWAPFI